MAPNVENSGLPFDDITALELAGDPAGELTGYLLALAGASVTKVEPPEGAATRSIGPFRNGERGPDSSLSFWYYNSNKQSLVLDIESQPGRDDFDALVGSADVLLSTLQPAELVRLNLDLSSIADAHPTLIILSVTAFGLTGPWKDYKSSELIGLAAGGPLHMCGYDDHSIPPILPGGNQAFHIASSFAFKALLLALIERQQSGLGQLIDVSMHEACAVTVELGNPYWFYPKAIVQRQTCRHAQPVMTQPAIFECADGRYVYFALMLSEAKPWSALVEWMDGKGLAAQLTEPAYSDYAYRQANYSSVQEVIECFFLVHDAGTVFEEGQARGLPIGIINSPEEVLDDPHLHARGFFVEVDHGEAGTFAYPGAPYQFSGFDMVKRKRAPNLGEHTEEVLAKLRAPGFKESQR